MDNNGNHPPQDSGDPYPPRNSGVIGLVFSITAILFSFLGAFVLNGIQSDTTFSSTEFYIGVVLSNLAIVLALAGTFISVNARKRLPETARGAAMAGLAVGVTALCISAIFALICDFIACSVIAGKSLGFLGN